MKLIHDMKGGLLTVRLEGELDHHCAMDITARICELIDALLPPRVRLDCSKMPFTDSSGIAVVMRSARAAQGIDSRFTVAGLGAQPMKVLRAAGVDRLVEIEEEVHI